MAGIAEYIKRLEALSEALPKETEKALKTSVDEVERRIRAYLPTEDKELSEKVARTIKSDVSEKDGIITLEVSAGDARTPAVALHEAPIDRQRKPDDPPDPPPIERVKKGPKFLSRAMRDSHPDIKKNVQEVLSKALRKKAISPKQKSV